MRSVSSTPRAIKALGALLALPLASAGCGEMDGSDTQVDEAAASGDAFTNPSGAARVVTVNGAAIDETNPFFQSLGTNGRACVHCHQPAI